MAVVSGDTIAVPITSPGKAAVSVVRVSGARVRRILTTLVLRPKRVLECARTLILTDVIDLLGGEPAVLDAALVAYFPAPNSFTGEDCLEFNLHGSPYLVERLLLNLQKLEVRLARAGEFTERAYLNGQIDLSQAEAVADIIAAETEVQARLAQQQLGGRLSGVVNSLGEPLRDLLALLEAQIDFPEEGIDPKEFENWKSILEETKNRISGYLSSFSKGRLCREGAQVVLAGVPNAGKSSLLNAICGQERAIVTAVPGTTRDSIEQKVDLNGLCVTFWDTAGIVQSAERVVDEVEAIGIQRSWNHLRNSDLAIFVIAVDLDLKIQLELLEQIKAEAQKIVVVLNKVDLQASSQVAEQVRRSLSPDQSKLWLASAANLGGINDLCLEIRRELVGQETGVGSVMIANRRHFDALNLAADGVERARESLHKQGDSVLLELVAADIRSSLGALEDIVGVTNTEDILGRIFSKFCIGK